MRASPPQIAPKTQNSAFLENTTGSKKGPSKKNEKVLPRDLFSMARGRTPPNRQSFRGCPSIFCCRIRARKGAFDATCGRLPIGDRGERMTRQNAFPRVGLRIVDQRVIAFTAGHAGDAVGPFGFGTAFGLGAFAVAGIYGLRRDDDRLVQHLLHRLW